MVKYSKGGQQRGWHSPNGIQARSRSVCRFRYKSNRSCCGYLVDIQLHFTVLVDLAGGSRVVRTTATAYHPPVKNPCLYADHIFQFGNAVDRYRDWLNGDVIAGR